MSLERAIRNKVNIISNIFKMLSVFRKDIFENKVFRRMNSISENL